MTSLRPELGSHVDTAPGKAVAPGAPARSPMLLLGGICLLAAVLYGWGIGDSWGNSYYSAAVKAMSRSWENFFFGAFDPAGVVTVDKPPMSLWLQVLSASVLGYNKFAVLFPQVVAGVAAVFLLHRTVRRWAGEGAALVAALVLALTPITVAINRDNNPDTLLVLLVVAAAYAMTRAIASEKASRWLLFAAFLVGCGFLTKMLQAWMVLPAFIAAYLIGREASWPKRLLELGAAAVVLVASSFWWVAATALWPSPKPYIGGSDDGSAWDLVFGYNGFGRIFGGGGGGAPTIRGGRPPSGAGPLPGPGGPGGGGFGGEPGLLRMFNEQLAGQISWLLPACLLILVAVVVARRQFDARTTAGWVLWGGWLLVVGLTFSFSEGILHPYYSTMLAPAVGAIAGAGIMLLWRWYRAGERVWVLPVALVLTVGWAFVIVLREPGWNGWAAVLVGALGAAALAALLTGRRQRPRLARSGLVLALCAVLAVPAVWSASVAMGEGSEMGGTNPMAGPSTGPMAGPLKAGARPGMMRTGPPGGDTFGTRERKLLDYVSANAGQAAVPLAVEGGAMGSASYIINSDLTVVGMGGFGGSDDAPSVRQLDEWKRDGDLGYVLLGGGPGGARPAQGDSGSWRVSGAPGGEVRTQRSEWVEANCTAVRPAAYGADEGSASLYDCR